MADLGRQQSTEAGFALLTILLAILIFSLLGLYMTLNATTELHISDNYESRLQATYSALAGLNHAQAVIRGLALDDLLKGPDGVYSGDPSYVALAKTFPFRSPLPLLTAQALNIFDPSLSVAGIADDGLVNTGFYEGTVGTSLIPVTGISQSAPNPYGRGVVLTSRYFVKVTDNNGEASEMAGDPDNNPFVDGDGIVIVRSVGIAKTIAESTGPIPRLNSVAVFETRLKRLATWDLGPALVVLGPSVDAAFADSFEISGGMSPGIGTIDTAPGDSVFPDLIIRAAAGSGNITGGDLPSPSVQDIAGRISSNPDQSLLRDPRYLWKFIRDRAPAIADYFFDGSQSWLNGSAPYIGSYDSTKPLNAPEQDPKITVVNGDLQITGDFSGGGLLIVTGNFSCSGPCSYNGLILVVGSGRLAMSGSGQGVEGGVIVASLAGVGGEIVFGTPGISVSGNSRFLSNRDAVKMAIGLIPATQISFREIAGSDP